MKRLLLTSCLLSLFLPGTALAGPIVGIGEQNSQAASSPLFLQLGVKHVRVTVPWDAAIRPGFAQDASDAMMQTLTLQGIEPLVVIGNSRYRGGMPTSVSTYRKAVAALVARYPQAPYWSPTNEPNLFRGKRGDPRLAANFTKALAASCRKPSCTVTSPTVIDANNLASWTQRYRSALSPSLRPKIWLLHNYIDANNFHVRATAKFMRLTRSNQVWLAETGGLIRGKGKNSRKWPKGFNQQIKVFRFLTGPYAKRYPNVRRIYIYQWQSSPTANWDSGIVNYNGTPRPVYQLIKNYLAAQ